MKYLKSFEKMPSEWIFNEYEKSIIIKRFEKDETPELILINIMKQSFLGDDGVLYGARFVKSYKDNKASEMYQYKQEVIYPTDIILYKTNNLKDGLKELDHLKDIESEANKYNI